MPDETFREVPVTGQAVAPLGKFAAVMSSVNEVSPPENPVKVEGN